MFGKTKTPPLKSLIAKGTVICGDISFEDGLRVDGEVHGNVQGVAGQATVLVIGEGARVSGEVVAEHVIVNGEINGPVTAQRLIELQPKAVVHGDVHYRGIELHLGAMVTGRLCPIPEMPPASPMPMTALEASDAQATAEPAKD